MLCTFVSSLTIKENIPAIFSFVGFWLPRLCLDIYRKGAGIPKTTFSRCSLFWSANGKSLVGDEKSGRNPLATSGFWWPIWWQQQRGQCQLAAMATTIPAVTVAMAKGSSNSGWGVQAPESCVAADQKSEASDCLTVIPLTAGKHLPEAQGYSSFAAVTVFSDLTYLPSFHYACNQFSYQISFVSHI